MMLKLFSASRLAVLTMRPLLTDSGGLEVKSMLIEPFGGSGSIMLTGLRLINIYRLFYWCELDEVNTPLAE
jgi:hypothetical protein